MKKQKERKFKDKSKFYIFAVTTIPYAIYVLKNLLLYLDQKAQKWAFDKLNKRNLFHETKIKL